MTQDLLPRLEAALQDRYRIERPLGAGGMATVYLAHDLKHHRKVAIKVLRPELSASLFTERFLREIEITANLNHPHILPLLDSGEADGSLYYVMPLVEGESLRDRLNREKQLPVDEAVKIASEVADALGYAHGHNVIHRDVKPENIMLEAGHAVVADFGIARAVTEAGGERLTETGIAVGTPAYLSPEQARGESGLDGRSDVYSLACVLYEMLAGEAPYTAQTPQAVLAKKLSEPTPRISVVREIVPAPVEAALTKALAKIAVDRFPTPLAFAEALEQGPTAPARVGRRRVIAVTVALGAVLAVGAWWIASGVTEDASRTIERLAVLPLANLTGDLEQAHLVEGMHEALIAELAQIGALTVISRQSVLRYRDTEMSVPEIARELGVDAVVQGSVFRAGDRVRVTAQLLQGLPEEEHLWADSYDKDLRDVLALYNEVAQAIATEINVTLTPGEAGRLATARVVDPAAYEDYLRGQYEWNKLNKEGWEAAIGHFQRSIEEDPSYAPAHAMMSFAYSLLGYYSLTPPATSHSRALLAAERAVELDSLLAEAHASLGLVMTSFDWDWAAADRASQEGLRLNPSSTMALYSRAMFLSWVGRHEEAIDVGKRAIELDPVAPHVNTWVGMHYFIARRYDEAISQLNRVVALEADYRDAHIWLCYSYAKKGIYEEAARESAQVTGYRQDWWPVAWILGVAGQSAQARRIIDQIPPEEREKPINSYFLAPILGEIGEKDRAFDALERAYRGRTPLMAVLKVDPRLDSLREDLRFQGLLQRMNFPQ
ncbi:MAG: protein kinase [Gemmatimonadota bacterium]|nr:MAG: protein kinase [Gemmatimonadota bacterium]